MTSQHDATHKWHKYATRILDVIIFQYTVKVRPMPGMWIQSKPVTAIPWGGLNIGQRGALLNQVCKKWSENGVCELQTFHGVNKILVVWTNLHGVKSNLVGMNKTIFGWEQMFDCVNQTIMVWERVLFIGTQFSNLYIAVDTPAKGRVGIKVY